MESYARLADLTLTIDAYRLEGLELRVSAEFVRHTTVVRLMGRGAEGLGEDVSYDANDQRTFQTAGPSLPLTGSFTLAGFFEHLDRFDLFPAGPSQPAYRNYRRWAFEAAALDLALRQVDRSLAEVLDLAPAPVHFVASMGLGHPPDVGRLTGWLQLYPWLRFKLDAGAAWSAELVERLEATGAVDTVDLKGAYAGTPVDLKPDAALYARVARGLPGAWIEDPALTPETEPVLADHRRRITWDAPIHSVADIRALAFPPRVLNFKPSRFGTLEALFAAYDHCRRERIGVYGGGQWELGPGRGQIQYLAALYHPDAPNDVAPGGYNATRPRPGLAASPLKPRIARTGFQWEVE